MPIPLTYPGVYIEEVPSGVRTITGVATSITAFIGRALQGPVNDPVRIQSFADYTRMFGDLWQASPMSQAVNQFFQHGGSDAIIVRVFNGDVAASTPIITLATATGNLVLEASQPGHLGLGPARHRGPCHPRPRRYRAVQPHGRAARPARRHPRRRVGELPQYLRHLDRSPLRRHRAGAGVRASCGSAPPPPTARAPPTRHKPRSATPPTTAAPSPMPRSPATRPPGPGSSPWNPPTSSICSASRRCRRRPMSPAPPGRPPPTTARRAARC